MKSILLLVVLPLILTTAQDAPTHNPAMATRHPTSSPTLHPASHHPASHHPAQKPSRPPSPLEPTPGPTPTRSGSEAEDEEFDDIDIDKPKKDEDRTQGLTSPDTPSSGGMSAGGKAAISIFVILVVAGAAYFVIRRRRKAAPRTVESGVLDADGSDLAASIGAGPGDSVDADFTEEKLDDDDDKVEAGSSRIIL